MLYTNEVGTSTDGHQSVNTSAFWRVGRVALQGWATNRLRIRNHDGAARELCAKVGDHAVDRLCPLRRRLLDVDADLSFKEANLLQHNQRLRPASRINPEKSSPNRGHFR